MNVLLKKVTVISSSSPFHRQVKDILIIDGIINKIGDDIPAEKAQVISGNGLHVSIGWMDIFANFSEPGNEQKETLETGANAAASGGFTDVMLMPDTNPAVSSRSQVEFTVQRSLSLPVTIHPIGAVTKNAEGTALAEMYDMHDGGAVAFSDGRKTIQSAGILMKALQYVAARDAVIIQLPDDKTISEGGLMHEGVMSTKLGLPGKPAIAEELMIARDIELLRYSSSKLHITGVSTAKGLALIAAAKKEGLPVTCSVTPYNLFFCDEDLEGYDSNLKLNPPLRTRADMEFLRGQLLTGNIDCIASHHTAQHWDDKVCEFEYAKSGMIGLQTAFPVTNMFSGDPDLTVKMFTEAPRNIFGMEIPEIKAGETACLTVFEPATEYIFEAEMIRSKSKNTPFTGKHLKGKVIGIIHKNKAVFN